MVRFVLIVMLSLVGAVYAAQDDPTHLQQALALEKTVKKVIRDAEPSIVAVLVSRSDLFARFGQGPSLEQPGKLGALDRDALLVDPLYKELSNNDRKNVLQRLDMADAGHVPESSGSGAIIHERGLVLTPYHVVQGATKILVRWPGGESSYADIYAADPRSDLAVLRLLRPNLKLPAIRLGDGGKIDKGQFVVALACPWLPGDKDAKPSAAWGIVSNMRQKASGIGQKDERGKTLYDHALWLQTDARIHQATSGGILFSLHGEAVALISPLAGVPGTDAAGSFALPLTTEIQRIVAVLQKGEEMDYGFLGVRFEPPQAGSEGVKLAAVTEGSPADQAGLKMHHVILAAGGVAVANQDELLRVLVTHMAGDRVKLEVRKPGSAAREKVDVVLAKYLVTGKSIATELGARPIVRGLRVDYTSLLVQQPGTSLSDIPRGVLISDVAPNSPAGKADLKAGAVITHVNDRAVATPAAFYESTLKQTGPLTLTLYSSDKSLPPPKVTLP